jgi:hypothetical protein
MWFNPIRVSLVTILVKHPFVPPRPAPQEHVDPSLGDTTEELALTHLVSDRAQAKTFEAHGLWTQAECHRSQGSGHLLASGHSGLDLKRISQLYFSPQINLKGFCPLRTLL